MSYLGVLIFGLFLPNITFACGCLDGLDGAVIFYGLIGASIFGIFLILRNMYLGIKLLSKKTPKK